MERITQMLDFMFQIRQVLLYIPIGSVLYLISKLSLSLPAILVALCTGTKSTFFSKGDNPVLLVLVSIC